MSQAEVIGPRPAWDGRATLKAATRLWFVVTLIGQWAFLYYVAGDPRWDMYFGAHVMLAVVIAFAGTLQLLPAIRERAIGFHRWNGRVFMLTALAGSVTGLWMVWMRGAGLGGGIGLGANMEGPMALLFDFACYLLPLAVLELYLRARDRGGFGGRIATAATLLASTAYMCVGIFGLTMAQVPLVLRV